MSSRSSEHHLALSRGYNRYPSRASICAKNNHGEREARAQKQVEPYSCSPLHDLGAKVTDSGNLSPWSFALGPTHQVEH
jgi:hypothetical protein